MEEAGSIGEARGVEEKAPEGAPMARAASSRNGGGWEATG